MITKRFATVMATLALFIFGLSAAANAADSYELKIHNHQFEPATLTIPAGVKVKLVVKNLDNSPEEFESYSLHREKLIPASGQIIVYIGPLDAGTYHFFGDFHSDTAKGQIIAK